MKIRMRTTAAGPEGVLQAEREYAVSAEEGRTLCAAGYAVELRDDDAPVARPVESAVVAAPENASLSHVKSKGGRRRE